MVQLGDILVQLGDMAPRVTLTIIPVSPPKANLGASLDTAFWTKLNIIHYVLYIVQCALYIIHFTNFPPKADLIASLNTALKFPTALYNLLLHLLNSTEKRKWQISGLIDHPIERGAET